MTTEPHQSSEASLEFTTGPLANTVLQVTRSSMTIGRNVGNDIILMDPKVSRTHARLTWTDGVWRIERLSRTSGISVDSQSVEQAVLRDKSVVGLGDDIFFTFRVAARVAASPTAGATRPAERAARQAKGDTPSVAAGAAPVATASSEVGAKSDGPPRTELASLDDLGIPMLEVVNHSTGVARSHALAKETLSVGRDPANDIVIDEPFVSARHFQLVRQGKRWELIHPHPMVASTLNGLIFEGRQVGGGEAFRRALAPGELFRIGDDAGALVTLTFRDSSETPRPTSMRTQQIPLGIGVVTIGRDRDNALVLDHPQVSAHHARVTYEHGAYRLSDLGSTNSTYVNGLRVGSQLLQSGDVIRIGPYKLVYEDGLLSLYDESGSIRIDALNLVQTGTNATVLLDDISLCFPPRSFVALVGASGAGKSTLLDALSGLRPAASGSVLYNGQDYYKHRASFSRQIGYVPQDEIIHRDLTVERALYYAAKLRLPSDFSLAQITQRIDEVLDDVEMRHRRGLLIKQLSGGQRKRVSIALELLANPSVFFLDEPTSGLDPGLDRKMMLLLRKLADKGHTIILVTHATSNINVCDYVCFLAQGGRVAYFGPPEDASSYFEQPGFAEIYGVLEPTNEEPELPVEIRERFKRSKAYQRYVGVPLEGRPSAPAAGDRSAAPGQKARAPWRGTGWRQYVVLCTRYVELLWNDRRNLLILVLQAPVIAILLSIFIHQLDDGNIFRGRDTPVSMGDAQKFLFVLIFSAVMFGSINAAREIVKEINIYRRERTVNLKIVPYLFSKITVLGVFCLFQCMMLILIINFSAPFGNGLFTNAFWEVYVALVLSSLAGLTMGLALSSLVPNSDQAMSFIPVVLIPQVIFSGAIFPLRAFGLQVASVIFAARWGMASVGSSVHINSAVLGGDSLFGTCAACSTYRQDTHYLLTMWGVLAVMIIVLTVTTGYLLKRKDVRQRTK